MTGNELERLVAERPPTPEVEPAVTAAARAALVRSIDARQRPHRGARPALLGLAVAAAVLLVVLAAGALVRSPASPPPDAAPTFAVPRPEVDGRLAFAFTPSPDLPPDPSAPLSSAVIEPGGPAISELSAVDELSGGQAPARLDPPGGPVPEGGTWSFAAAPLQYGPDRLEGTCEATLVRADAQRTVVEVSCGWGRATSEETWVLDSSGGLISWDQRLTPTGSSTPGTASLQRP